MVSHGELDSLAGSSLNGEGKHSLPLIPVTRGLFTCLGDSFLFLWSHSFTFSVSHNTVFYSFRWDWREGLSEAPHVGSTHFLILRRLELYQSGDASLIRSCSVCYPLKCSVCKSLWPGPACSAGTQKTPSALHLLSSKMVVVLGAAVWYKSHWIWRKLRLLRLCLLFLIS